MFDPFKKAQKWKLEQILKYTPINIPNGLRKLKKVGSIAIGNQISHPKNVEKTLVLLFKWFLAFLTPSKRPQNENYTNSLNIPLEISLMVSENQRKLVALLLITR